MLPTEQPAPRSEDNFAEPQDRLHAHDLALLTAARRTVLRNSSRRTRLRRSVELSVRRLEGMVDSAPPPAPGDDPSTE